VFDMAQPRWVPGRQVRSRQQPLLSGPCCAAFSRWHRRAPLGDAKPSPPTRSSEALQAYLFE